MGLLSCPRIFGMRTGADWDQNTTNVNSHIQCGQIGNTDDVTDVLSICWHKVAQQENKLETGLHIHPRLIYDLPTPTRPRKKKQNKKNTQKTHIFSINSVEFS